jgi:magnesium transporter
VNRGTTPFRITPPPQPKIVRQRSFLTRRSTSFYTHSYPQQGSSSGVEIPYIPPAPERLAEGDAGGVGEDGKRKERKAKYLESLMDKAGELSLRCELALCDLADFFILIQRLYS